MKDKNHQFDPDHRKNPLSEEEIKILRTSMRRSANSESQSAPKKVSKTSMLMRYAKKNKLFSAAVLIITVTLFVSLVLGSVFLISKIKARGNTSDFTVILKYDPKNEEKYTVKYSDAMIDGILYLDLRKISSLCSFTVSGTDTSIKFTVSDKEFMRFEDKNEYATLNGYKIMMEAPAKVNNDSCLVPFSFIRRAFAEGVRISLDENTHTITVGRVNYAIDTLDGVEYVPTDVLFDLNAFNATGTNPPVSTTKYEYTYTLDISKYLSCIDPTNASEYLMVVNKSNHLSASYVPVGLTTLTCNTATGREFKLRYDAAMALEAMMKEMLAEVPETKNTFVTSAYRSYKYQEELYEGYVEDYVLAGMSLEEAMSEASKTSARAGESEHQTGLCLDFMTNDMTELDESFEKTAAFEWLSKKAHKFGFILRYPKDKVGITEYSYEPWHYRFVGRTAATEIYNSGLCLEEYLEQ